MRYDIYIHDSNGRFSLLDTAGCGDEETRSSSVRCAQDELRFAMALARRALGSGSLPYPFAAPWFSNGTLASAIEAQEWIDKGIEPNAILKALAPNTMPSRSWQHLLSFLKDNKARVLVAPPPFRLESVPQRFISFNPPLPSGKQLVSELLAAGKLAPQIPFRLTSEDGGWLLNHTKGVAVELGLGAKVGALFVPGGKWALDEVSFSTSRPGGMALIRARNTR